MLHQFSRNQKYLVFYPNNLMTNKNTAFSKQCLLPIILNIPLQQTFIKFVHFQESGQAIKCQHCAQSFHDMKSLQIHNFLDHHIAESPTPPLIHQSRNSPVSSFTNERNPSPDYHSPGLSCHICGMNVPNQTAFQQV